MIKIGGNGLAIAFITAMISIIGAECITDYNDLLKRLSIAQISMRFQNSYKVEYCMDYKIYLSPL